MAHTPNRKPILAVVSSAFPDEGLKTLRAIAASVILLPPDPLLPSPVASHPDMLLFSIGDRLTVHRLYYETAKKEIDRILTYTGMELILTDCPRGPVYPLDIGLNALLCGQYLFGRTDALAPEILTLAAEHGITPVPVRQGYAGCSGLVVGEAILTADPSISKAASACGIPVIPVQDKEILLPGYDHGFFGGCGGVWKNTVYLCGTPHPAQLEAICRHPLMYQKNFVCLSNEPLQDCGGIKIFSL